MNDKTRANLETISVATVSMQLLKRGIRNVSMVGPKPLNTPMMPIVGEAYTLRYIPMREDLSTPEMLAKPDFAPRVAIEEAPSGSILVIDGRGRPDIAVVGDILIERLKVRGVTGLVSDGGLRDFDECLAADFPVFAAGPAAPASVTGHAAGDLQTPISCGGVAVIPGDIIKADGDGVIVIPKALAEDIGRDGLEQERYERFAKLRVSQGRPVPGIYPPNDAAKAEYAAWLEAGEE
ncbi:MAG: ribonuclease activity regulator RraA [Rhodospirillaceae bacterium]|jgi:regulator of RNase E activity RraA|nr:ribonuclease activity regulator RraA [Rhodospirillaceae bacterium]MBT3910531.1 ribonuclease activity regulator RraA [Rhodospirillaceae bacterium]MBT5297235.1 ribonuclease activity regulator RraA [Rhodospirillaceae bacterium]MBT5514284.1 ribonuclease activity regulator RraA [Rhodospirillaceae bacterium]MBT6085206.1 ribonuclease activity regulator RraA [Rhodospirillaceae bacterium]